MEIFIVIEFDFDGKFSDAQSYSVYTDALDAANKIHEIGGTWEIVARNQK